MGRTHLRPDGPEPRTGDVMTGPIEDDLRRALDDVLATCWADEIPLLDALTEAVTDWTAQIEAEFNESKAFDPGPRSQELAEALAAMAAAVDKVSGTTTSRVFTLGLTEALRDWSAVGDTVGRDLERSFSAQSVLRGDGPHLRPGPHAGVRID